MTRVGTLLAVALAVTALDGGTVLVNGVPYKVDGYYAPRVNGSCRAETMLGHVAKSTLSKILASPDTEYKVMGNKVQIRHNKQNIAPYMMAEGLGTSTPLGFCNT